MSILDLGCNNPGGPVVFSHDRTWILRALHSASKTKSTHLFCLLIEGCLVFLRDQHLKPRQSGSGYPERARETGTARGAYRSTESLVRVSPGVYGLYLSSFLIRSIAAEALSALKMDSKGCRLQEVHSVLLHKRISSNGPHRLLEPSQLSVAE